MIEDDLKRQKNKEAEKLKEKEKRYVNIIIYKWDICLLNWYQNPQLFYLFNYIENLPSQQDVLWLIVTLVMLLPNTKQKEPNPMAKKDGRKTQQMGFQSK